MVTAAQKMAADPELTAILRTYNDVTERLKWSHEALAGEVHRLRDELDGKNKELQRREHLAALGEMAAGVAHEIRNPLGGIGLYASLLERDLKDRPQEKEIARRIGVGVVNLETIVRDILAFAGGAEPRLERAEAVDVVKSAVAQASARAEAKRVKIDVDDALGKYQLRCDFGQIERALLNLILNAIEAVGQNDHVWIRAGRSDGPPEGLETGGDCVSIVVEDDGPGFAPGALPRVFNPFFTTKDSGTGLGLAIVHGIVEAHGGSVTAGSRVGGGASVMLSLPVAKQQSKSRRCSHGHADGCCGGDGVAARRRLGRS